MLIYKKNLREMLGNHMFYNGLGNKNSGLSFSKKGPAAGGVGPKRKLLKTTSVQVILSSLSCLKTALTPSSKGAAGFMGLRPLPPAPLMAKWLSGSVAKSLCA